MTDKNSNLTIFLSADLRQLDGDYAPHALVLTQLCPVLISLKWSQRMIACA